MIPSSVGSKLKPCRLTQPQLLSVGRIIRACAEIEDIVSLYMYRLADITEGQATVLLGRTPISTKMRIAKALAYAASEEEREIFAECFEQDAYFSLMSFRNMIAHGVLLGQTEDGGIAFQVQSDADLVDGKVHLSVEAARPEAFSIFADMANNIIPQLETRLKLQPLRESRRQQELGARLPKTKTRRRRRNRQAASSPQ